MPWLRAVCDDGAAMAADTCPLERWAVGLGPLLACPVFEDAQLLAQSTGKQATSPHGV
jgi:hypothetical protein